MCLTGGSLVSAMGENEVISRETRALGERNVVGKSKVYLCITIWIEVWS